MNLPRVKLPFIFIIFVSMLMVVGPVYAVYKCKDEKGVTYYGDTMPSQCAKNPVVEMSTQGSVMRKFDAPLTPEQIKAIEDDKIRNKEKMGRMALQKLRDDALMSTYGAEREFDIARDKEIANLESRRKTLLTRTEEVEKALTKLNNDMEFYQAGKSKTSRVKEAPPQLVQDHKRAVHDAESLRAEIEKIDKGKEEIRARYDTEKARWKRIKDGLPAGTLLDDQGKVTAAPELRSQIAGQSQIIPGRPKGIATCDGKVHECTLGTVYQCLAPNIGSSTVHQKSVKCVEDRR